MFVGATLDEPFSPRLHVNRVIFLSPGVASTVELPHAVKAGVKPGACCGRGTFCSVQQRALKHLCLVLMCGEDGNCTGLFQQGLAQLDGVCLICLLHMQLYPLHDDVTPARLDQDDRPRACRHQHKTANPTATTVSKEHV